MALTLKNAGALVPGVKPEEDTVVTKTVRVIRSFFSHEGKLLEKDSIVTLPRVIANQAIAANKAVVVVEEKASMADKEKPKEEVKPSKKA